MSDLIDREALLRQIDIDSEGEPGYYGDTWKFIDTIKRMPSALSTNLAQLGTDLISRQAAIEAVQSRHMMLSKEKVLLINDLEKLPPAEPQIIRCKDCKYYGIERTIAFGFCFHVCELLKSTPIRHDDDFCSRAERRTE